VDTRILGEHIDAAVLSVMKDRSRLPQLVAATETLRAHGTPLLGVVVNACNSKTKDYGYYT
ncbi:MAG: protein tyrosine kinase, partial [Planctomycetota bacterium]